MSVRATQTLHFLTRNDVFLHALIHWRSRISPKTIKSQLITHFNTLNQFQCLTRYDQQTQKYSLLAIIQENNMLWAVEDTTNKWRCAIIYRLDQKYIIKYIKVQPQNIYLYKDLVFWHFHDNQALYTKSITTSNYINKNMVWKCVFKSHLREIRKKHLTIKHTIIVKRNK